MDRQEGRQHFPALDALRGIAAIAVALFHVPAFIGGQLFPSAYLAVDLFFCISGVVLVQAYGDRLAGGGERWPVLRARSVRLYPMALLAGLCSLGFLLTLSEHREAVVRGAGAMPYLLNLLLIPCPLDGSVTGDLYPLNFVAWTLLAEMIVSLCFILRPGWFLEVRQAAAVALISLVALILSVGMAGHLNLGFSADQFPAGMARAGFSFALGAGIAQAWRSGRLRRTDVSPLLLCCLVVVMLCAAPPSGWRAAYDLAAVMVAIPAIVTLGCGSKVDGPMRWAADMLGSASYPVYLLQVPFSAFAASLVAMLGIGSGSLALGAIFAVTLTVAGWWVDRHIDRPVRRWLTVQRTGAAPVIA
ncbi:acyltransferase [Sphingobium amiense]|uniref:Acyltransferase n=1 Tax=Sphingobium amiense TaxID=135719 RepID=A0A494W1S8_9SPHN|nr:acyltransferase [Sphingobium amiense]BBD97276.1 acyltransferase [Sphingobium amiense]